MANMLVDRKGTVVTVAFPDDGVEITAERIRDRSGYFTAELYIYASLPFNGVMSKVKVNHSRPDLLDVNSKNRLIENLEEKTRDYPSLYWGEIVDAAVDAVIDKHREGEPEAIMGNLEGYTPRTYAIKPLFVSGVANLIWAPGGSSKSYLSLLSCVMVDKGLSIHGLRARKGVALYLDWEETAEVFRHRLAAVHRGLNIQPQSGVIYKKMKGSLADNVEYISKLIMKHNVTFMVVDSVGAALGGSGIDQDTVNQYFDAGNILGITWLSVDHANRAGETTGKWQIHGSAYKYNRSRQVYEVKKVQEHDSGDMEVVLYHRKANDSGLKSPRGFSIHFESEERFNKFEDDYDTVLQSVSFDTLELADANDALLKPLSIGEICYSKVKTHGSQPLLKLAITVASIKGVETVSEETIETSVNSDSRLMMSADNKTVVLAGVEEESEWTG